MFVKMGFAKCSLRHHHKKSGYLSSPTFQDILAIFLLLWLGLAVVTVAEEGEDVSFLRNENSSFSSSNNDTLTQPGIKSEPSLSPSRHLTVTKGSSRTIATSTVRPWPSHNFFRSILSKSDNIVGVGGSQLGKENRGIVSRSSSTLIDHNYESGGQDKEASHRPHLKRLQNSRKRIKNRVDANSNAFGKYQARRRASIQGISYSNKSDQLAMEDDSTNSSVSTLKNASKAEEGQENRDKARSVAKAIVMTISTKASSNGSNANSDRKFYNSLSQEEQGDIQVNSQFQREQNENAIFLSRASSTNLNGSNKTDEYSHMDNSEVGFQYEIVLPPPTPSSRPPPPTSSSSSLSSESFSSNAPNFVSTSLLYIPSTTAVSTTFRVTPSSKNSSGNPNNNDTTLEISTSSAVSTTSANDASSEKATTTTTTPFPLSPSHNEKTTSAHSVASFHTTTHSFPSHYQSNKSNESLHYLQSHPTTPTQPSQLNGDGGNSFQKPEEPQTYPAKNRNEIHTELKGEKELSSSSSSSSLLSAASMFPMKINHNFGNSSIPATYPEPGFTMASSPTPTWKIGREGNSSSANGLTLKIALRNNTSAEDHHHHHHQASPPSHLWNKSQPTHFSQTTTDSFSLEGDPTTNLKLALRRGSQTTSLINRKNMFTVVNNAKKRPSLHVESRNGTKSAPSPPPPSNKNGSKPQQYLSASNFHDRTNQVERPPPSVTTAILAGPDRSGSNYGNANVVMGQKDNDYFDEDEAQAKLHHWIESEQGHYVSGSKELPTFTNLTWPYYITTDGNGSSSSSSESSSSVLTTSNLRGGMIPSIGMGHEMKDDASATASPKTALTVSFSSPQRKEKVPSTDFNSRYEFYIPSAAADPLRNPILVAKLPTSNETEVPTESWTRVPTLRPSTTNSHHHPLPLENGLKQSGSDPQTKVKQNHWGSKGVNIKEERPQTKVNPPFPSSSSPSPSPPKRKPDRLQENIKVYESSTGNPKSTPSTYFPNLPLSSSTTFATFGGGQHGTHFSTFHIPTPSATWPILGGGGGGPADRTEMASFVTAKTPTNIWYKPIINHFTATVPINGTSLFYDALYHSAKTPFPTLSTSTTTTPIPFISTMLPAEYVGDEEHVSIKNDKTFYPAHSSNFNSFPVLFKVWKLIDGKLTLETQREIPSWAMEGHTMPATGTILNLQQIPPPLQPLVTSAMSKEAEANENGNGKEYIWHRLPTIPASLDAVSPNAPLERLPSYESNQQNFISGPGNSPYPLNDIGSGNGNRPISINYVLWNNPPPPIHHGQSIILSTSSTPLSTASPPHQFLLFHKPTPVSYFPSSPITLVEGEQELFAPTTPPPSMVVTVKRPHGYLTFKTPPTTIKPTAHTMTHDELELLFQNYFQYVITTPTPAPPKPTASPAKEPPLFEDIESHKPNTTNSKAWSDLKKLILRLAANGNRKKMKDKTSTTQEGKPGDYLDYLGNVAAITLIMNYLQNQQAGLKDSVVATATSQKQQQLSSFPITKTSASVSTSSSSPAPYGVTDDMTPPHKDQLWATTYPLFQHMLSNPKYTFIPPPPKQPFGNPQSLSDTISPTPEYTPIPFTEPPVVMSGEATTTTATMSSADEYYSKYNHYASYPTGAASSITRAPYTIGSQVYITEVPKHGATTERSLRFDINKLGELGYDDPAKTLLLPVPPQQIINLLVLHKLLSKKKGGGGGWGSGGDHKKKKKKLAAAAIAGAAGATLLKKIAHVVKKPSKYWLDLKFDIDFYELIKKQLLYWLAYRYMPVAIVLAFGLIPVTLSLVPLLYKALWSHKKPKYIKVPVPIHKPYPVVVYKDPPHPTYPHYPGPPYGGGYDNQGYSPPGDEHNPDLPYENEADDDHDDHQHNHNDDGDSVIHIDSQIPPTHLGSDPDHYYSADSTGKADEYDRSHLPPPQHSSKTKANRYPGYYRKKKVNSFNYNDDYDPSHPARYSHSQNAFYRYPPTYQNGKPGEEDQQIHVHIHDDEEETQHVPQYQPYRQQAPVTYPPSFPYTSYSSKDLQPYPVTKSYEMGFDLGQMLNKITNKQDMEIFKILIESKKEKINNLLEMWKLAKYGVGVASSAATNLAGSIGGAAAAAGAATTPLYSSSGGKYGRRGRRKGKGHRKRRRKKRKPLNDDNDYANFNSTLNSNTQQVNIMVNDEIDDNN